MHESERTLLNDGRERESTIEREAAVESDVESTVMSPTGSNRGPRSGLILFFIGTQ